MAMQWSEKAMKKKAAVNRRRRGEVEQKSLRKFQRKVECANRRPTCEIHENFVKRTAPFSFLFEDK